MNKRIELVAKTDVRHERRVYEAGASFLATEKDAEYLVANRKATYATRHMTAAAPAAPVQPPPAPPPPAPPPPPPAPPPPAPAPAPAPVPPAVEQASAPAEKVPDSDASGVHPDARDAGVPERVAEVEPAAPASPAAEPAAAPTPAAPTPQPAAKRAPRAAGTRSSE